MTVSTRFAPSPTGYLHIGGARTALFSWLYAKKHQGNFILRIEDTDRERSTQASVNAILDGMQWLQLDYQEGPFYQTQRIDRYREIIQQLLDQGDAYYCYCSKDELDQMREEQKAKKQKPRYDQRCRHRKEIPDNISPVIRFCNPDDGEVVINDLVRGTVRIKNAELDDLIIARSDGTPTYNLTVVVDDMDMQVSHVIRGDDHLNNTPRQINILQALHASPPVYAHLPMILGADGARLSKRHGAVSVLQYKEEGYLPQALLNYLVRLGWSHQDQEIFNIDEMIDLFDLSAVNKSASIFNPEKLLWLNQQYIKTLSAKELATHLYYHLDQLGVSDTDIARCDVYKVIETQQERAKTLVEMAQNSLFFFKDFNQYDTKAAKKNLNANALPVLEQLLTALSASPSWQAEILHQIVLHTAEKLQLKLGKVAQPLRVAVAGQAMSPSIDITLELLGKDRTLQRIHNAINYIRNLTSPDA